MILLFILQGVEDSRVGLFARGDSVTKPCMEGHVLVWVCQYVHGGFKRETKKGQRREREKGNFDESADSCWLAAGRRVSVWEGQREDPPESAASRPLIPRQIIITSDCHVIVPVRWQCVCQDCVSLVDIAEAC